MTMAPTKRTYEFGDVVLISYYGRRPAVVISAASHNAAALDIVVMTITKQEQHAARSGAIVLDRWKDYGLTEPSIIKPVISSIPVEDLDCCIGSLDESAKGELREAMAKIFGGRVRK